VKKLSDYPHLEFRRCWSITHRSAVNLGRCTAYLEMIGNLPISPTAQKSLRQVSLQRGAQATTAIEGNTITDEEMRQILEGQEVFDALSAMTDIRNDVVDQGKVDLVNARLLCKWNQAIGKELGPLYDGVPGRFRTDRRHVGRYLAPPHENVPELVEQLCDWLHKEFAFDKREQPFEEAIQEAIAAHVYFEWIHPFADGNGRTGRLLEFYILLRSGFPDVTAHVLANHYNNSRGEYAAHFVNAQKKRDLTDFMDYAIQGLCDGLQSTLVSVQKEIYKTAWESHVYRVFDGYKDYNKIGIFKRRRALALAMPIEEEFEPYDLVARTKDFVRDYLEKGSRVVMNDIEVIRKLELLVDGETEGKLRANIQPMLAGHIPSSTKRNAKRQPSK
jgi:Fic family protein